MPSELTYAQGTGWKPTRSSSPWPPLPWWGGWAAGRALGNGEGVNISPSQPGWCSAWDPLRAGAQRAS